MTTGERAAVAAEQAVAAAVRGHRALGVVVGVTTGGECAVRSSGGGLDASTLFSIGSITKTCTGLALAAAVVAGEVRLDSPLAEFAPEGVRVPAPITLHQLARHTSGLPRLPRGVRPFSRDPYARMTDARLWSALARAKPSGAGVVAYSNFGAALLGAALARRAGVDYGRLIAATVSGPLGLGVTTLTPGPDRAVGHTARGKQVPDWHMAAMAGCGGLWSSADDLLRLVDAHLAGPGPLADALALTREAAVLPGEPRGVGLGLFGLRLARAGDVRWHNGMTSGFSSFLGFSRSAGIGVVLLADHAVSLDPIGVEVLTALTS